MIDHIDGDPLNNRRENLRWVTQHENVMNSRKPSNSKSCFRGVSLNRAGRWVARIILDGKRRQLGTFPTAYQAALRYDEEARNLFGKHAALNFPIEGERSALR